MTKMTQIHIRLDAEDLESFDSKLTQDHGHTPSRSAVVRSWVIAYLDGRLRIDGGRT